MSRIHIYQVEKNTVTFRNGARLLWKHGTPQSLGLLLCEFFFRLWAAALPLCMSRWPYGLSFTDSRHRLAEFHHAGRVRRPVLEPVEKYGFRLFAVAAPLLPGAAGQPVCRRLPYRPPEALCRLFARVITLFAAVVRPRSCCFSPFWTRCSSRRSVSARSMSMLHSFFAQQIFVVLATIWPAGGAARWQWILCFVGGAACGRRRAALFYRVPLAIRKAAFPAPCRCGRWPAKRRVLRAAGGRRAGRRGRGDHGPVGVGALEKGHCNCQKLAGDDVGRAAFSRDACAGAAAAMRRWALACRCTGAHRRQRRAPLLE